MLVETLQDFAKQLCDRRPLIAPDSPVLRLLTLLVDRFDAQPALSRREIKRIFAERPMEACGAAMAVFNVSPLSMALTFLAELLVVDGFLIQFIADPEWCTDAEALEIVGRLVAVDPKVQSKLAAYITRDTEVPALNRVLLVLEKTTDPAKVLSKLVPLLGHPNPRVRSKAVELVGRGLPEGDWWASALTDSDARVRANAVEALWGLESEAARAAMERASHDEHHRVVVNALVGLHRAGVSTAAERLRDLAGHTSELFRAAAVWGLGVIADGESVERLQGLRKDSAEIVRRNALRSLVRIRKGQTASGDVPAEAGAEVSQ